MSHARLEVYGVPRATMLATVVGPQPSQIVEQGIIQWVYAEPGDIHSETVFMQRTTRRSSRNAALTPAPADPESCLFNAGSSRRSSHNTRIVVFPNSQYPVGVRAETRIQITRGSHQTNSEGSAGRSRHSTAQRTVMLLVPPRIPQVVPGPRTTMPLRSCWV